MCKKKIVIKKGDLYESMRTQIRPFDAIFFGGDAIMAKIIKKIEKHGNNVDDRMCEFSHVGMVVTSEILLHPLVLPGKYYILESTLGGYFGHGIKNIENKTCIGVQLRDLDEVVKKYDKSNKTVIAWAKVNKNPLDIEPVKEVRDKFTEFFTIYNGKKYDANPYSLFSAVFKCLRPYRKHVETFLGTDGWFFCSEIIALAYKYMSIYPVYVNEKDVLPRDILYPQSDIEIMPTIVTGPNYITTSAHYYTVINRCHKKR
jgi:hypothetical protein